jgi:hypothetical protein
MDNLNNSGGVSKIELSKTQIGVGVGLVAAVSASVAWWFTKAAAAAKAAEVARVNNLAIAAMERRIEMLERTAAAPAPAVAAAPAAAPAPVQPPAPAPAQATVAAVNAALTR